MKSCMVVYSYYPFDPRVRKEVRALVAKGHTVDVICLRDEGEANQEVVDGATIHRTSLSVRRGGYLTYAYQYVLFFLLSFCKLTRLFLRHKFDVIHVHSLPDFQVFVAIVPKLYGKKVILDLHEAMPEIFAARFGVGKDSWQFRFAAVLEIMSSWFADSILTVNDAIRDRLVERDVEERRITIVMNSPDVSLRVDKDLTGFMEENNLKDKFVLIYIGGINPERNIEVLVEAVGLLKEKMPIRLFVFGYGKDEYIEDLKQLRSRLGVETEVHFGGWIPHEEVLSYLNLGRIGVVSYVRNPLTEVAVPNKVFEFAALGKPLIIARLDALENLFKDSAVFYEPENARDLSNKILQLSQDTKEVRELSQKAQTVYDGCRWDVMKQRLYDVYESLRD
jgi:glycosyltransferase involved in cell wall biosynthesis